MIKVCDDTCTTTAAATAAAAFIFFASETDSLFVHYVSLQFLE